MPIFFDTLLSKKSILTKIRLVVIVFACICFCSAIVIANYTVSTQSFGKQEIPCRVGPIQGDGVYTMSVVQGVPVQSWAFLEVHIETKDGQTLFSVGKELWHEKGRDSEGSWEENDIELEYDFVLPKGEYYLKVEVPESSVEKVNVLDDSTEKYYLRAEDPTFSTNDLGYYMSVDIKKRLGAPYVMLVTTIISFLIAIILTIIINRARFI